MRPSDVVAFVVSNHGRPFAVCFEQADAERVALTAIGDTVIEVPLYPGNGEYHFGVGPSDDEEDAT